MKKNKKLIAIISCMILLIGAVGATIAWLTDKTNEVVNTFTVGDINIELTETWNTDSDGDQVKDSWTGKMIPGDTLDKNPKVTVKAGSEACWLFVKVTETCDVTKPNSTDKYAFSDFITYSVITGAGGWNQLMDNEENSVAGVYYREVADLTSAADDLSFAVIRDASGITDKVTVKDTVTKEMLEAVKNSGKYPTLTFKAYAVQKANVNTAFDAWAKITE